MTIHSHSQTDFSLSLSVTSDDHGEERGCVRPCDWLGDGGWDVGCAQGDRNQQDLRQEEKYTTLASMGSATARWRRW